MRQVFFLLISAMFAAFSLSWASSKDSGGRAVGYLVPGEIQFPLLNAEDENILFAKIPLRDSCQSLGSIQQERRGQKIIFSIRAKVSPGQVCSMNSKKEISLKLRIEPDRLSDSLYLGVYFREDDEKLKYFGAVSARRKSISWLQQ